MKTLNSITYHDHAFYQRMPQRGVDPGLVELLVTYGEYVYQHDGTELHFFTSKSLKRMESSGCDRRLLAVAQRHRTLTAVLDVSNQVVITVYPRSCSKRVRRDLNRNNTRKLKSALTVPTLH